MDEERSEDFVEGIRNLCNVGSRFGFGTHLFETTAAAALPLATLRECSRMTRGRVREKIMLCFLDASVSGLIT